MKNDQSKCVLCGWTDAAGIEQGRSRVWFGPDLCGVCAAQMRGLSLWQPWAGLIAVGEKTIETRFHKTNYRGRLLICSAQKFDDGWRRAAHRPNAQIDHPSGHCHIGGHALAIAELTDCWKMRPGDQDGSMVKFHCDRWCWELDDVRPIVPFAVTGRQGLFGVNESILRKE